MSVADPLHDAAAIEDPYDRALALAQASDDVPDGEREAVLSQALSTASGIDDPRRQAAAMMSIADRLDPRRAGEVAREALQRASKDADPEWLARFLLEFASHVPEGARDVARSLAEGIRDERARREVMGELDAGIARERTQEPAPETAIAVIETPDGIAVGAGVLIEPDVVLTAISVLDAAAGSHPQPAIRVRLPFASAVAQGEVDAWRLGESLGIATVHLTTVVPGIRPARLMAPRGEGTVRVFGFSRRQAEGLWVTARITGQRTEQSVRLEGATFEPGFGGAPVWEPETGEVVGVVHSVVDDGGAALMTPGPVVTAVLHGRRTTAPSAAPAATPTPPSAFTSGDRWTLDDRLDYALYARAIAEFITHRDATPPMVISVQAPWGQGKTSLMKMVQANLDPGHPALRNAGRHVRDSAAVEPPSQLTYGELRDSLDGGTKIEVPERGPIRTVWFNAWMYQSSEQVWAGLAHAILDQLPARLPDKEREQFWLRLQLRRIDPGAVRGDIYRAALERFLPRLLSWVMPALGVAVAAGVTLLAGGLDAIGAAVAGGGVLAAGGAARGAWSKATKESLERPLEGAYLRWVRQPDYESRLGYLHLVEQDMLRALDLLTPDDQPVVIFIDDLDRCSPEKVGEVLEAINLFLAGDYPNCAFVMGIDAEVVAASMEVVHEAIIRKLDDRRGELGWRFMDKFVQLPFVMPRLGAEQRKAYLKGLMWTPSDDDDAQQLIAQADELAREISEHPADVDRSAKKVGELARQLAPIAPERARALGEQVVSAGAQAFSDDDAEVSQALETQLRYLSDNPRTIKRAVNLYRFHRFAAFARQASIADVAVATPEQIGRWVVAIIRWPHFVRWLQTQHDDRPGTADAAVRVGAMARDAETPEAFAKALGEAGIEASWTDDRELWEFLREDVDPDLALELASARGLW